MLKFESKRLLLTDLPKIMDTQTLKELIKESVREVLQEERLNLSQILIPEVDDREMAEIEKKFNSSANYDLEEFVNMTDWVKHGD